MTVKSFKIAGIPVGPMHPPVFLAEIGGFFNENTDLAAAAISGIIAAAKSVPDQPVILKGEILDDPEICLPTDVMEPYADKSGNIKRENYRAIMERKAMPRAAYIPLFKLCRDAGMPFCLSVYDMKSADFGAQQGAASLKIASSNVVHVPLIRHVAKMALPMIIDTGRTTLDEVRRAVDTARNAGCNDIALEHSPDGHPSLPAAHNLRILQTYADTFGLPTGLSDHHVGVEMLYVATALGASVLEKGVHTNPDDLDMDVSHSMALSDLPRVLANIRDCYLALGKSERNMADPIKGNIGTSQRQCVVALRDLKPGDVIDLDTVRFAFPRTKNNVPVEDWDNVAGKPVLRAVKAGQPLEWPDVKSGAA